MPEFITVATIGALITSIFAFGTHEVYKYWDQNIQKQ